MDQATLAAPRDAADLVDLVHDAGARGARLALHGGDSHAGFGAPLADSVTRVDLRALNGIIDHDPAELVLTVRAGTPLALVEAQLAAAGQMLAFEPFDHGPLHGRAAGAATIGGVIAAGVAGSRRLSRGGARDHLLGFAAVAGDGQAFVGGARVTKNVTGYDLPKLACGAWGRLFALTELHIKTVPRPECALTVAIDGLDSADAVAAMSRAMGSAAAVAAAAHDPAQRLTVLRLEGVAPSVAVRARQLEALLAPCGAVRVLNDTEAQRVWAALRDLAPLAAAPVLWRVVLPAAQAPALLDALAPHDPQCLIDWAGGLVWLGTTPDAPVRAAAAAACGQARLMRAPPAMRASLPALAPRPAPVALLEARVARVFDPAGVFETGRMGD